MLWRGPSLWYEWVDSMGISLTSTISAYLRSATIIHVSKEGGSREAIYLLLEEHTGAVQSIDESCARKLPHNL